MASLNTLSVQAAGANQGLLMPKLKYRFRAIFTGFGVDNAGLTELTKQVVDIKRPNVNFNPITIDVYNSKVFLQGKPEWQDTTINIRDDATGAVSKMVGQQVQKQFDFLEQASAPSGGDYKFSITYEVLDGGNGATTPNVLESWELDGCLLSQVDWGDMAYNSNDPVQIALTIKFDNAIQTSGISATVSPAIAGTPGGTAVGGTGS